MGNSLDNLLNDIECKVSEQDVKMCQLNVEESKRNDAVRMIWRMYAADPFADPLKKDGDKQQK